MADLFKVFSSGFFGIEGFVENSGELIFVFGLELAGDFKLGLASEIVDFFLAFDDEAKGRRLDAAGRDSTRDLAANDAGEVVTDEHIEGLASLL